MKTFLVICFLTTFGFTSKPVFSQDTEIIIESDQIVPVEEVFDLLKEQTTHTFIYSIDLFDGTPNVNLKKGKTTVGQLLESTISKLGYTIEYKRDGTILVFGSEVIPDNDIVEQEQISVSGTVIDPNGMPIPGVNVIEEGTSNGVVTNFDGEYAIDVPPEAVLVFSYLGYATTEIEVDSQAQIDVSMKPEASALEEIVVVGYGTQRKVETLGAQSTISVKDLKQPVADISTVLAGRISGLVGVQRGAEPGLGGADIWIRGINTMSNSSPLILVDGVERDFHNLDPIDIESFTILKDAASTSVYGVRGANGVILITTKSGIKGPAKINLTYYQGITEFTQVPEPADGITYMQMANEASVTRGGNPIYSPDYINKTYTQEDPYLYPNVNWMNHIFNRFGHNEKANLNISGGTDKVVYYVSAGYYKETGLFTVDDLQKYNSEISFTRYNFTSNLTFNATKTTTFDLGIKGWISNGNYPGTGTSTIFAEAFETYPILYPLHYPNGVEPWVSTGGGLNNPYYLLTNRGYSTLYNNQINSDIRVEQDLDFWVEGLSARVLYAFDAENNNRLVRNKIPYTVYATGRDENGDLIYDQTDNGNGRGYLTFSRTNGGERQFYLEAAINYDREFGKHDVGGLALFNTTDRLNATAGDLIGSIPYRSLGAVGRLTYSYDDRYFAEGSFGYNGAENFASSQRFGFFPAGAVGWVVSNENFWANMENTIQFLKLRASYGVVGNSKIQGRRFAYIPTVVSTDGYSYGQDRGNYIGGLDIGEYAANVTWETQTGVNLGMEFRTLNNDLSMQFDFFRRRRENIFLERGSVPAIIGLRSNLLGNLGITTSEGVDFSGDYTKNFGDLSLQVKGTFTYNKNELLENDQPTQPYPYMNRRGHPINQRFGYIAEGYYTQEEIDDPSVPRTTGVVQAGDIKFRDLNDDGIIDGDDVTAIGQSAIPQIVYGFGTTLSYKGFSLGAFFQGVAKVDLYLSNQFMPFREGSARGGLYENIRDRWTPENPSQDAFYPRLSYGSDINQNYSATSSHWLMNGDFLRLKTLDFGWTIPRGSLGQFGVKNMRLFFIGYNLWTLSSFDMYDPELGNGSGTRYPNIRTYSLGVNLTF